MTDKETWATAIVTTALELAEASKDAERLPIESAAHRHAVARYRKALEELHELVRPLRQHRDWRDVA